MPPPRGAAVAGLVALALLPRAAPLDAQSRLWRDDDRALFSDFSYVTAIAASQSVVYVATARALVLYDRASLQWRATIGVGDGYPATGVVTMVADPMDDAAWLAGSGQWYMYRSFGRQWDSGPLPGTPVQVVLDRDDPSRGAYFQTSFGWYLVRRGGGVAEAALDVPPPARRQAPLTASDLRRAAPALDAVVFRLLRDDRLRASAITAAAADPIRASELFVGTGGNGAYRLDALTYATDRLPAGLLATGAGGLASDGRRVCVGTDTRGVFRGPEGRRGVTCMRRDISEATLYEDAPFAVAGMFVRRVAITPRAVWAASDAGLLRFGRRDRPVRLRSADGLPGEDARALAAADDGMWVGTSAGLAFVSDEDRPEVVASTAFGGAVGALLAGRDTLWIGSSLGLLALPRGASEPVPVSGLVALREPIVALAMLGDTLVAATGSVVAWRVDHEWRLVSVERVPVGRISAMAASRDGLWVAGSGGIALLVPRIGTWTAWTDPADVPLPVADIAADRDAVWVSTPEGLVRFDRRALVR